MRRLFSVVSSTMRQVLGRGAVLLLALLIALPPTLLSFPQAVHAGSQNFTYTGAEVTWTVPAGVFSVTVDMAGAEGGNNAGLNNGTEGWGGRMQATLTTTPGETLRIGVGGKGGDGSGATGGSAGFYAGGAGGTGGGVGSGGGGGGGQSYIKRGGSTDAHRVLVAGGGGGTANNNAGGAGNGGITLHTEATASSAATAGISPPAANGGGGGGGGWVGGTGGTQNGGGNNNTGSGGSNMAHSTQTSGVTSTGAYRSGDGYVNLSYTDPTKVTITTTGDTTWTVPDDWTNDNTIEVIGGGGGGGTGTNGGILGNSAGGNGGGGGGGGAYSRSIDIASISPGADVTVRVGAATGDTYVCDSTSNCASIAGSAVVAGAKGGVNASGATGGAGGVAASGVASGTGSVKTSGGSGGSASTSHASDADGGTGGGGGGGAGGFVGDGGGGGVSDGLGAGTNNGSTGGDGGAANTSAGVVGGTGGLAGGLNGCNDNGCSGSAGNTGSNGTEFDGTNGSGSGGGGGGGGEGSSAAPCSAAQCNGATGGAGGSYGAGGGGGGGGASGAGAEGEGANGGNGRSGIVIITYTPATAPDASTGLTATGSVGQVSLSWTAPVNVGGSGQSITNYKVYRDTASPATTLLTTIGNTTNYTDTDVTAGTTYFYRVIAVNYAGLSGAFSNEDSAAPTASVPDAPTNLVATAGSNQVNLSWTTPASNGGSAITGYKVYRDGASPATTLLDTIGVTNTYTDSTATNGNTYFYRVKATNAQGDSAFSNEDSAMPQAGVTARVIRIKGGIRLMGGIRLR